MSRIEKYSKERQLSNKVAERAAWSKKMFLWGDWKRKTWKCNT